MEIGTIERVILVIDGDKNHQDVIQTVFQSSAVRNRVVTADNSLEAMNYLRQEGQYTGAPRPDLILLDFNLPQQQNGQALLGTIKSDPAFQRIPTIVLTSSEVQTDIFKSYELHGNCYVVKSNDRDQLTKVIQRIEKFWLEIVTLPLE